MSQYNGYFLTTNELRASAILIAVSIVTCFFYLFSENQELFLAP